VSGQEIIGEIVHSKMLVEAAETGQKFHLTLVGKVFFVFVVKVFFLSVFFF
jgi:hypothetical protein